MGGGKDMGTEPCRLSMLTLFFLHGSSRVRSTRGGAGLGKGGGGVGGSELCKNYFSQDVI
jgi:hypothetical protein